MPIDLDELTHRRIVRALQEGIWIIDADANTTFVNEPMTKILGYAQDEMLGKHLFWFMDERGVELATQGLARRESGIREQHDFEFQHRDGHRVFVAMATAPLEDDRGTYLGAVAGIIDLTDRRLAEDALRESEARFRAIFTQTAAGVLLSDPSGSILSTNPAFQRMLGYSREELEALRVSDITLGDDLGETQRLFTDVAITAGKKFLLEKRYLCKDGSVLEGLVSVSVLRNEDGHPATLVAMLQDLSDIRRAEGEQLRVQKLESLGVLAGGIAHDYNNLLTTVIGNLSLALSELAPGSSQQGVLLDAQTAALQAAELSKQLLVFSRGGSPVRTAVDLAVLVVDTSRFALAGTRVLPKLAFPAKLPAVHADQGQLAQVVTNLITNAVQAQPDGGTLSLTGRVATVDGVDYVELEVSDEGPGIPPEIVEQVFDPYFTTKAQGTGLGLAVTHSIVQRHEGHIHVHSVLGHGATFTVRIPVWSGPQPPPEAAAPDRKPLRAKVLIMDDEPLIRKVATGALKRLGCTVSEASEGEAAVALHREAILAGSPYDVMLIDLTVPGHMGGQEAVERMRELDPDVRAIVSSGYSTDPIMAEPGAYGFSGVLQKPWRVRDLDAELRRVLAL